MDMQILPDEKSDVDQLRDRIHKLESVLVELLDAIDGGHEIANRVLAEIAEAQKG